MSESTTASTELTSQYTAQVSSDLERNLKEQERVSGEISALQQQLATLQHDHTVLVNMQQALGITPTPAEPITTPAPAPTSSKKATSRARPTARARKATATPDRASTRKPAKKAPAAAQPSLVELIREHLAEQKEPRSTAEIADALQQAHPERGIKNTVVRTTLENIVAKGQAQRTKQGSSVYYTASDTPTEQQQEAKETQPEEAL
ncbi:hypothetical protein [Streptomyces sp. NPDC047043]|uniref:hypothetical protein n=1 Tax=Streptomyces sp. NPDC047043 TaxID=3154497 RepID=UPI0033EFCA11